jgi:regulator of telomere elongation helicase 1
VNKDRASAADLIFMPYNYLIDEKIQENFEIEYANSILIFDEAHNVSSSAEEVSSFELRAKFLEQSLTEIHQLQEQRSQNDLKEWKTSDESLQAIKNLT